MSDIEETFQLVPGSIYRKWWCQECGTTIYEEMPDKSMDINDPFIVGGFNNRWEAHDNDSYHKVVAISIFKHRNILYQVPQK
jgi:hypothetical protein